MSARERRKGADIEREIVNRHVEIGIHAERYPQSGATRFRGKGHDVDVYIFGVDEAPFVAEVKGRKSADGFRMLERWLGDYDLLFLRRNRSDPLVLLPWATWEKLLGAKPWLPGLKRPPLGVISDAPAVGDAGGENGKTKRPTNAQRAARKTKAVAGGTASR